LTLSRLSSLCIDNALLHSEIVEQTIHRQHLKIAGQVQKQLMPESQPEVKGFDICGVNLPADDTSGDYFDFLQLGKNKFCFVLADATGHGIGAALIATTARAMLRTLLLNNASTSLSDTLQIINELMNDDLPDDKFLTLFLGVIDTEEKTLSYANAGHEPCPIIYDSNTDSFSDFSSHGLPLGMFGGVTYDEATTIDFNEGSLVFLCSDGIPEAHNISKQFYGKDRIKQQISQYNELSSKALVNQITGDVMHFVDCEKQNDDITLMVIKPD